MSLYEYTQQAQEAYYDISDYGFTPQEMYNRIKKLEKISFSRHLKRLMFYCFFTETYSEQIAIPLDEFKAKFVSLFKESETPCAFTKTTAKLSTLAESCLTKRFVRRSTVFLIGFGLGLDVQQVNDLLTKGIQEHGINPKDPFEVICWYCYENSLSFYDYQRLWSEYEKLEPKLTEDTPLYRDYTVMAQRFMLCINSENELKEYLSKIKTTGNIAKISKTSLEVFTKLIDDAILLLDENYGSKNRGNKSIEGYLYNVSDDNGNIPSLDYYDFEDVFGGVRLSKQRIGKIRREKSRVNRYDIINLCFLVFSLKIAGKDTTRMNLTERQQAFVKFTDGYLERCMLGKMYPVDAYDSMILCCVMSEDPLETFENLWSLSEK